MATVSDRLDPGADPPQDSALSIAVEIFVRGAGTGAPKVVLTDGRRPPSVVSEPSSFTHVVDPRPAQSGVEPGSATGPA